MTIPSLSAAGRLEGPELDALTAYLQPRVTGGVRGTVRATLIAGGRSNPTYEISDGSGRSWVLRRPPYGHVLPTAHDMGREHTVLTALHRTSVPVPRTIALCEDRSVLGAPFYVMEKVDGTALRTQEDTSRLNVAQRRGFGARMISIMADLHRVEPAEVGLADFGRPDGYLERQLSRWQRQWDASATSERPEVRRILDHLGGSVPQSRYPGIVHGDYKTDNLLVDRADPTQVLAVLDWEMSTLGDTLADLGVALSFWDEPGEQPNPISAGATALPGFGTRRDVLQAYATASGRDLPDVHWYVAFADFKIAVILEGIHARHLQGHTSGPEFDDVGAMVGPLLERALDGVRSPSDLS